jgi:hypothetical protein
MFGDCIILLQLFEAQLFIVYFMKHMYMIKGYFFIIWNNNNKLGIKIQLSTPYLHWNKL